MQRRDLLKNLAMLPFAGMTYRQLAFFAQAKGPSALQTSPRATPASGKLRILLEGPFALVMQAKQEPTITIVSPMMEPSKSHHFLLDHKDKEHQKRHSISLLTEVGALKFNDTFPKIIDPLLTPSFTWQSQDWDQANTDNLLDMNLPSPDSIQGGEIPGREVTVFFQSNPNVPVRMPSSLILEYTVTDTQKLIELTDPMIGVERPQPTPGLLSYDMEVGLPFGPLGQDPDAGGGHAVTFHNDFLLPRFPSIKGDKDKLFDSVTQKVAIKKNKMVATATTFECKLGGFIVSTP